MNLEIVFLIIFSLLILKFAFLFVLPYFFFWRWFPGRFKKFKIQNIERQKPQLSFELKYTIMTIITQTCIFTLIYWGVQKNIFQIYRGFGSQGYLKELIAFIFYIVFYDIYFYWSHRFLHWGWFYREVHVVHHRSQNPNPFTSFSFHPIEAIINLLYFFPVVFLTPMSLELFIVLVIMTDISNLGGHLGYEFIPRSSRTKWWGRWLTTPTHHNMHHQFSKSNFALYWRGWDDIFKTMHPKTEIEFYRIKDQS